MPRDRNLIRMKDCYRAATDAARPDSVRADAAITKSFTNSTAFESDLGKRGYGEVEFKYRASVSIQTEYAGIGTFDWHDDDDNVIRSLPTELRSAIEVAISKYMNSSEFQSSVLDAIAEKLG
jgi:hypothetical protein